ncbi:NAD-dependent epimerase/dehydratase family protein [[Clostridium] polysaccharolyticum]|uniref:Nucleoside-diphosphate-sugar epimerase n=1 Tax=[Clostridium] polysaccharolyticum TaxID=29364 RepID=A0A1I0E483_9FIRM|nr:NAD-dependent epimerase/dehydratase family protein [[Clostridium] polysaccharolyticum]SET39787.1 Nucleoside-diphosphate-sugar epimerase [[Clostridium] polysaccharolyticum]
MKILLLGGAGFVGTCLTQKLIETGDDVSVIDLQADKKIEGTKYYVFDCMEQDRFVEVIENTKYDVVVDFCCMDVAHMEMILPILNETSLHYILCSTVSVYDFEKELIYPINEDAVKKDRDSLEYGAEKAQCEDILIEGAKSFNYTIIRPCYIYGLDCQNNRFEFIIDKIVKEEPVVLSHEPESVFPLLHVEDLANAIIKMRKNENVFEQVVNICPDELISLKKFVKLIASYENKNYELIFDKEKKTFINKLYDFSICFSNEKLKCLIGWKPEIKLYDGFKQVYESRKDIIGE